MFPRLKSFFWTFAKAESFNTHLINLQHSDARALIVKPKVRGEISKTPLSGPAGLNAIVGSDYLMSSGDNVDAVYYLGGSAWQFKQKNAYFTGLGAIRQYSVKFGKVFILAN